VLAVPGVTDFNIETLELQANTTGTPPVIALVEDSQWLLRNTATYSGNAIPDTRSPRTLDETLTFEVG